MTIWVLFLEIWGMKGVKVLALTTLEGIFRLQEGSVHSNQVAMSEERSLLDIALPLTMDSVEVFKSEPVRTLRREVSEEVLEAEGIRLNLAHAIWSTVINSCRLLEYGAFVNAFSLYRDALEQYAYFWYFGVHPSKISMWMDLKNTSKSIIEYGREDYRKFSSKVVGKFKKHGAAARFHEDMYELLSTLGTHTNPHSLSMFLPKQAHEDNYGFYSSKEDENLICCAHSILHLILSLLEDLYEGFEARLPRSPSELRKVAVRSKRGRAYSFVPTSLLLPRHSMCLPDRYAELRDTFKVYDSAFQGNWGFW